MRNDRPAPSGTYPALGVLIDGTWHEAPGEYPVIDPATEEELSVLPRVGTPELEAAVAAAVRGFAVWRRTAPSERCAVMLGAVKLLRERRETIARVMTCEQGKPLAQACSEVDRACAIIEWDANEGLRVYGRIVPAAPGMTHAVHRRPLGPVAAFAPWNFPASGPARKIGGALSAGCSIILKPAEETPGTAVLLARAFQDAGLPSGVLNVVFGEPAAISSFLIARQEIRLVTFTGSVPMGKKLAALAGEHMKPAIMELGGHAPVIVCADTDPARAAALCLTAKARNAGQVCVAPTRFFVHESIHDAFLDELARRADALPVGNGADPTSEMGPLANMRRVEAMETLVDDAVKNGARTIAGGRRLPGRGYFYPLTVLAGVSDGSRGMVEEPFGPLALVKRVATLEEAVTRSNALPYALAAYAFTDSVSAIATLTEELHCGNLAVNHMTASFPETPFGGVKDSGYGREGGTEGLEHYTTAKLVSIASAA